VLLPPIEAPPPYAIRVSTQLSSPRLFGVLAIKTWIIHYPKNSLNNVFLYAGMKSHPISALTQKASFFIAIHRRKLSAPFTDLGGKSQRLLSHFMRGTRGYGMACLRKIKYACGCCSQHLRPSLTIIGSASPKFHLYSTICIWKGRCTAQHWFWNGLDWESQFYHRQLKRAGWCPGQYVHYASMPIQKPADRSSKEKSPRGVAVSNADCVVAVFVELRSPIYVV